jgi:hypothetical protein
VLRWSSTGVPLYCRYEVQEFTSCQNEWVSVSQICDAVQIPLWVYFCTASQENRLIVAAVQKYIRNNKWFQKSDPNAPYSQIYCLEGHDGSWERGKSCRKYFLSYYYFFEFLSPSLLCPADCTFSFIKHMHMYIYFIYWELVKTLVSSLELLYKPDYCVFE